MSCDIAICIHWYWHMCSHVMSSLLTVTVNCLHQHICARLHCHLFSLALTYVLSCYVICIQWFWLSLFTDIHFCARRLCLLCSQTCPSELIYIVFCVQSYFCLPYEITKSFYFSHSPTTDSKTIIIQGASGCLQHLVFPCFRLLIQVLFLFSKIFIRLNMTFFSAAEMVFRPSYNWVHQSV